MVLEQGHPRIAPPDITTGLNRMWECDTAPPLLYHYTDFEGLTGIIQSHVLRATYSRTLNDGSEQRYGLELAAKVFRQYLKLKSADTFLSQLFDKQFEHTLAFVICFCQRDDSLSMWRSYAGHGGGYCLGFRIPPFRDGEATLTKVIYGEDDFPESLRNAFTMIASGVERDPSWDAAPFMACCILADRMKHRAFREEQEWRIIVRNPPVSQLKFRSGHANVKPYVDVRLGSGELLPLERVICGPTLRTEDATGRSIKWLLENNGYKDVKVEMCDIPYRL